MPLTPILKHPTMHHKGQAANETKAQKWRNDNHHVPQLQTGTSRMEKKLHGEERTGGKVEPVDSTSYITTTHRLHLRWPGSRDNLHLGQQSSSTSAGTSNLQCGIPGSRRGSQPRKSNRPRQRLQTATINSRMTSPTPQQPAAPPQQSHTEQTPHPQPTETQETYIIHFATGSSANMLMTRSLCD
ncbi:hypothetical protein E2C01_044165 [Portunus trituberculatus]|uniref:Uncharacterized protein n=1 Tax=Portunus trituberculatus TaxID=210409 RepID=A0A5B7FY37_PORTR|nr:hypothetical protein [Portunus trituberculatus]